MLTSILLILAGLVALYFGAEWLVKGASSLAIKLGMTPLVAGLTVVAFGTSSPELVVSITASLAGSGDIALGNVIGSNIFNIAVILGITAAIVPVRVQPQILKIDTPFMIGISLLFAWFFMDRVVGIVESGILFALLIGYVSMSVYVAKRHTYAAKFANTHTPAEIEAAPGHTNPWISLLLITVGLGVLIAGSKAFVHGAVDIARSFGVSEAIIGLTIVAAGTSLPELAASLVAAFRNQADIAIGNIVGSNIFNILCILGLSGMVASPLKGPGITNLDLWAMLITAIVLLPLMLTGRKLSRWEGILLLAGYGVYLYLVWPK